MKRKVTSRKRIDSRFKTRKPIYTIRVLGNDAVAIMQALKPHMSIRRQSQIDRSISNFKDFKRKFSDEDVREMRKLSEESNLSRQQIATIFNAHPHYVGNIVTYRTRRHGKN